jgi:hypothetical protein
MKKKKNRLITKSNNTTKLVKYCRKCGSEAKLYVGMCQKCGSLLFQTEKNKIKKDNTVYNKRTEIRISIITLVISFLILIDIKGIINEYIINKENLTVNFIGCTFGNKLEIFDNNDNHTLSTPVAWINDNYYVSIPIKWTFLISNVTEKNINITNTHLALIIDDNDRKQSIKHGFSNYMLYINNIQTTLPIKINPNESIKLDIDFNYFLKNEIGSIIQQEYPQNEFTYQDVNDILWNANYDIFGNMYSNDIVYYKNLFKETNQSYVIINDEKIFISSPIGSRAQKGYMQLTTTKKNHEFCFQFDKDRSPRNIDFKDMYKLYTIAVILRKEEVWMK